MTFRAVVTRFRVRNRVWGRVSYFRVSFRVRGRFSFRDGVELGVGLDTYYKTIFKNVAWPRRAMDSALAY